VTTRRSWTVRTVAGA